MREILLWLSIFVTFLLHSVDVKGQLCVNPGGGAFELVEPVGCVGKPVSVVNKVVNGKDIEYVYDFDKNRNDIPEKIDRTYATSFTYNKSGTYTILQYGSGGAGFTACKEVKVYETAPPNAEFIACKDGKVMLTLVDDAIYQAYDAIEITWGDGTKETVQKGKGLVYQKNLPTNPTATIKGIYNGNVCNTATKGKILKSQGAIPSLSAVKITRVEMGADGTARVEYEGMEGIKTELFVASAGGAFLPTHKTTDVKGATLIDTPGLSTEVTHSFKLVSADICGNPVESAVVHSVVLKKELVVSDETNSMTWDAYQTTNSIFLYQVLRNANPVFNSSTATFFSDDQVSCGQSYNYQLLVVDGDARSYSPPLELTPTTAQPEKIITGSVTVKDAGVIATNVNLTGNGITKTYNLIVERAEAGNSAFQVISPLNNQSIAFEDVNAATSEKSFCYRFTYENACKLSSPPSDPICSILLTNNIKNISWTAASPFTNTVDSYDLLKTDVSGASAGEIPKQLTTSHDVDLETEGNSSFQVRAQSGSMVSYSNVVSLRGDVIMLIPDIFTPNGDTHNDQFVVKSHFTNSFRMRIFSRWGEMVYQSENTTDGWDGNINGKPADGGYYIYKIDATTSENLRISKTGSLMLVR